MFPVKKYDSGPFSKIVTHIIVTKLHLALKTENEQRYLKTCVRPNN